MSNKAVGRSVFICLLLLAQAACGDRMLAQPVPARSPQGYTDADFFRMGMAAYGARNYSEAVEQLTKVLKRNPSWGEALEVRGAAFRQLKKYSEAVNDYTSLIKFDPKKRSTYLRRAETYRELGDTASAAVDVATFLQHGPPLQFSGETSAKQQQYLAAVRQNPKDEYSYVMLAMVDRQLRKYADAISAIDKALALQQRPEYLQVKGSIFQNQEEYEKATDAFNAAVKIKPDLAPAWFGLSECLDEMRRYGEALSAVEKAVALDPTPSYYWTQSGRLFQRQHEYDKSIVSFNQACKIAPALVDNWLDLADCLSDCKKFDEAVAAVDRALRIKPQSAACLVKRGEIRMAQKDFEGAVSSFSDVVARYPKDFSAHYFRSHAYEELGRYAESLADDSVCVQLAPDNACAWNNRGFHERLTCKYKDALTDLEKSASLKPKHANHFVNLARTYEDLGQKPKSQECYAKALELATEGTRVDPHDHEAWVSLIASLVGLKRGQEALLAAESATAAGADDDVFYDSLAECYQSTNDLEKALQSYDKAIAANKFCSAYYNRRGQLYERMGKHDLAEADLAKAKSMGYVAP